MGLKKNRKGLRIILISSMTREQLVDFIKRKDKFYCGASFAGHSDNQLRELAIDIEKSIQMKKKLNINQ